MNVNLNIGKKITFPTRVLLIKNMLKGLEVSNNIVYSYIITIMFIYS